MGTACVFPIEIPEIRNITIDVNAREPSPIVTLTVRSPHYPVLDTVWWVGEGNVTERETHPVIYYYPVTGSVTITTSQSLPSKNIFKKRILEVF